MKGGYLEDAAIYVASFHFIDSREHKPHPIVSMHGTRSISSFTFPTTLSRFQYPSHFSLPFLHIHPSSWVEAGHRNAVPVLGTLILEGHSEQLLAQLLCGPDFDPRRPQYLFVSRDSQIRPFFRRTINRHLRRSQFRRLFGQHRDSRGSPFPPSPSFFLPDETPRWTACDQPRGNGHLVRLDRFPRFPQLPKQTLPREFPVFPLRRRTLRQLLVDSRGNPRFPPTRGTQVRFSLQVSSRKRDLFFGIDVWGRGTRSGGGWNTVADLATLAQFGVSAAIFAPGWILEHECESVSDDHYREKERYFWNRRVLSVSSEGRLCSGFAEGSVSSIVEARKSEDIERRA